ncbi:MAG: pentapeptide repeat-containing protein [Anaerolineae bacterium]|nr:pentapeptide repeat-containing protein [Anaerolineae bacterium]
MANEEHLAILKQGVEVWNQWRADNPDISPDLFEAFLWGERLLGANLRKANLLGAVLTLSILSEADFFEADLSGAVLTEADLLGARLSRADLTGANLERADLTGADLSGARLFEADLNGAVLIGADLIGADLIGADLSEADLNGAVLTEANLSRASLVETNLTNANLNDCLIYGISAWNIQLKDTEQENLIITRWNEPIVTVDNLEVAQFVYLLLHNEKIRSVIDTITTKAVLILGRFTPERKAVLDTIRDALRTRGYVPILFDFQKPDNRDLTETVMTLAGMARFVIADLSDPRSIPHELMSFTEKLLSVPVQPIFCPVEAEPEPYSMFEHLRRYPHVLPLYEYKDDADLLAVLAEKLIAPAEEKAKAMRPPGSV